MLSGSLRDYRSRPSRWFRAALSRWTGHPEGYLLTAVKDNRSGWVNNQKSRKVLRRPCVLLIDDQPLVAEGVRRALLSTDIEFHFCPDPTQAIATVDAVLPTVILLDLVMPGVGGLTVLRFLRRNPSSADIPVVVLSSKENASNKADAFAQGANDYLVKLPDKVELEARIRYHSQAYSNLQALHQANSELQKASSAKSDFLARMSHEIRTPMNGIIGMVQLLLSGELEPDRRRHLEIVQESSRALLGLLNDLLDFSKVESGKIELDLVEFDLINLVDEVVQVMAQGAFAKGLELTYWCDPILGRVSGDPTRIRQIMSNLIGNAIKFTENGEVAISASLNDSQLCLQVRDTGIGIPSSARDKVFEPFSQADSSTTRRFGGTGLGLPICKGLAQALGGDLDFSSPEGEGTTFSCRLPVEKVEDRIFKPGRAAVQLSQGPVRTALVKQLECCGLSLVEEVLEADWLFTGPLAGPPEEFGGRLVTVRSPEDPPPTEVSSLAKPIPVPALLDLLLGQQKSSSSRPTADLNQALVKRKVLLAEDNPINQVVGKELLTLLNFELDIVSNGREAVEAVAEGDYALVLMDCDMPEMDGFEATVKIRELEGGGGGRLPIIAMTAQVAEGTREACLAAGMDDYISKPIELTALGEMLARWNEPQLREEVEA